MEDSFTCDRNWTLIEHNPYFFQFNDDFVDFVLNTIEEPPDNDIDDQVSDTLIGMLLSFNQHFKGKKL